MQFLVPHQEKIYAVTRMVIGFLFLCHGVQKLHTLFTGAESQMPLPMLVAAGLIESLGGAMVLVGFRASLAAFICSGTMAVAYFMVHQPQGLLPIQNGGELSALYCWMFLSLAARGSSGIWSVDGNR